MRVRGDSGAIISEAIRGIAGWKRRSDPSSATGSSPTSSPRRDDRPPATGSTGYHPATTVVGPRPPTRPSRRPGPPAAPAPSASSAAPSTSADLMGARNPFDVPATPQVSAKPREGQAAFAAACGSGGWPCWPRLGIGCSRSTRCSSPDTGNGTPPPEPSDAHDAHTLPTWSAPTPTSCGRWPATARWRKGQGHRPCPPDDDRCCGSTSRPRWKCSRACSGIKPRPTVGAVGSSTGPGGGRAAVTRPDRCSVQVGPPSRHRHQDGDPVRAAGAAPARGAHSVLCRWRALAGRGDWRAEHPDRRAAGAGGGQFWPAAGR